MWLDCHPPIRAASALLQMIPNKIVDEQQRLDLGSSKIESDGIIEVEEEGL